jgi:hypothetical protein
MRNWNYVTCKNKLQEIRGYENYLNFKERHKDCIDLQIVNTVYAKVEVDKVEPLIKPRESFLKEVEKSIDAVGFKDPFVLHNITDVPIEYRHGLFIKSGNNRIKIVEKRGIKEIDCIVVNISGGCFEKGCYNFHCKGRLLENEEDVRKLFYQSRVRVTMRGGKICNAYVPRFLKVRDKY